MNEQTQLEQAIRAEIPGLTPEQYVDVVGRVQWERAVADRRVAAEREACAAIADCRAQEHRKAAPYARYQYETEDHGSAAKEAEYIACLIRARGEGEEGK